MEKSRLLCRKWESGNGGLKRLQEVPLSPPPSLLVCAAQSSAGKPQGSAASPLHSRCALCEDSGLFFQSLAVKPS